MSVEPVKFVRAQIPACIDSQKTAVSKASDSPKVLVKVDPRKSIFHIPLEEGQKKELATILNKECRSYSPDNTVEILFTSLKLMQKISMMISKDRPLPWDLSYRWFLIGRGAQTLVRPGHYNDIDCFLRCKVTLRMEDLKGKKPAEIRRKLLFTTKILLDRFLKNIEAALLSFYYKCNPELPFKLSLQDMWGLFIKKGKYYNTEIEELAPIGGDRYGVAGVGLDTEIKYCVDYSFTEDGEEVLFIPGLKNPSDFVSGEYHVDITGLVKTGSYENEIVAVSSKHPIHRVIASILENKLFTEAPAGSKFMPHLIKVTLDDGVTERRCMEGNLSLLSREMPPSELEGRILRYLEGHQEKGKFGSICCIINMYTLLNNLRDSKKPEHYEMLHRILSRFLHVRGQDLLPQLPSGLALEWCSLLLLLNSEKKGKHFATLSHQLNNYTLVLPEDPLKLVFDFFNRKIAGELLIRLHSEMIPSMRFFKMISGEEDLLILLVEGIMKMLSKGEMRTFCHLLLFVYPQIFEKMSLESFLKESVEYISTQENHYEMLSSLTLPDNVETALEQLAKAHDPYFDAIGIKTLSLVTQGEIKQLQLLIRFLPGALANQTSTEEKNSIFKQIRIILSKILPQSATEELLFVLNEAESPDFFENAISTLSLSTHETLQELACFLWKLAMNDTTDFRTLSLNLLINLRRNLKLFSEIFTTCMEKNVFEGDSKEHLFFLLLQAETGVKSDFYLCKHIYSCLYQIDEIATLPKEEQHYILKTSYALLVSITKKPLSLTQVSLIKDFLAYLATIPIHDKESYFGQIVLIFENLLLQNSEQFAAHFPDAVRYGCLNSTSFIDHIEAALQIFCESIVFEDHKNFFRRLSKYGPLTGKLESYFVRAAATLLERQIDPKSFMRCINDLMPLFNQQIIINFITNKLRALLNTDQIVNWIEGVIFQKEVIGLLNHDSFRALYNELLDLLLKSDKDHFLLATKLLFILAQKKLIEERDHERVLMLMKKWVCLPKELYNLDLALKLEVIFSANCFQNTAALFICGCLKSKIAKVCELAYKCASEWITKETFESATLLPICNDILHYYSCIDGILCDNFYAQALKAGIYAPPAKAEWVINALHFALGGLVLCKVSDTTSFITQRINTRVLETLRDPYLMSLLLSESCQEQPLNPLIFLVIEGSKIEGTNIGPHLLQIVQLLVYARERGTLKNSDLELQKALGSLLNSNNLVFSLNNWIDILKLLVICHSLHLFDAHLGPFALMLSNVINTICVTLRKLLRVDGFPKSEYPSLFLCLDIVHGIVDNFKKETSFFEMFSSQYPHAIAVLMHTLTHASSFNPIYRDHVFHYFELEKAPVNQQIISLEAVSSALQYTSERDEVVDIHLINTVLKYARAVLNQMGTIKDIHKKTVKDLLTNVLNVCLVQGSTHEVGQIIEIAASLNVENRGFLKDLFVNYIRKITPFIEFSEQIVIAFAKAFQLKLLTVPEDEALIKELKEDFNVAKIAKKTQPAWGRELSLQIEKTPPLPLGDLRKINDSFKELANSIFVYRNINPYKTPAEHFSKNSNEIRNKACEFLKLLQSIDSIPQELTDVVFQFISSATIYTEKILKCDSAIDLTYEFVSKCALLYTKITLIFMPIRHYRTLGPRFAVTSENVNQISVNALEAISKWLANQGLPREELHSVVKS